ncbi:MAG: glutamate--tRNA ligase [Candidatus Omnitrophica bacterium]|nr:glutamate--tRNA ligase [Candidatus Omnitrophota bacterium]
MVRVRFAPSPTGFLHIGGARTALFNWMYAKAQGGVFVLRIEDTDKVRSKQEYFDEILDSMKWLGLTWDEFYKQSDRFDLYRQYAHKLLSEGKAYKDGEAVVLHVIQKPIKIYDLIRGEIVVDTKEIKDQVLMKSDGSPTYSFACVIDDALMEISCVIRGEDHISNTPKQILMYEAMGFKVPKFAHLPLIMDPEGGRMSKRAGATAVTEYRTQGYLPIAIVNYLMLLGWSPGNNQEKVSMAQALKNFSIKKINKAGAAFSLEKLQWLNSQYIKEMPSDELARLLKPMVAEKYPQSNMEEQDFEHVVHLYKGRMNTLLDFLEWTSFLFEQNVRFDEGVKEKHLSQNMKTEFNLLADKLAEAREFTVKSTEEVFRATVAELKVDTGTLVHPVRVALTGKAVGPGLFDTMAVLGQKRTVSRLREAFIDNYND